MAAYLLCDRYPALQAWYHVEEDAVEIQSYCEVVKIPFSDLADIMNAARKEHIRRNDGRMKEEEG